MKRNVLVIFFLLLSLTAFPQKLPALKVTVNDSSLTGFYMLSFYYSEGVLLMILDHSGEIAYYKCVSPNRGTFNFNLYPNGDISYANLNTFLFMDSTFAVIDSVSCKNPYRTVLHDMKVLPNGHYLMLGANQVRNDLSKDAEQTNGGEKDTTIFIRGIIQELDENKQVVFEWHAENHFGLSDRDTFFQIPTGVVDLEHINSVALDNDGNILLSSRYLSEITKINRTNGSVMWRWGGKRNQFTFVNCPVPFYGQHDIRRLSNRHVTLFDNGHHTIPHGARAMEFELDEVNKIATLKWSYTYDSALVSFARGSMQRLANGYTLVNYGAVSDTYELVFVVVDTTGRKLFELNSPDHLTSYRSFYYPSLPWKVNRPVITCFDSLGVKYLKTRESYSSYQWSDSSITRTIAVTYPGNYSVFVPYGSGGFIRSEKYVVQDVTLPCLSLPQGIQKKLQRKK